MSNHRFWMTAKFDSTCHECEGPITTGDRMVYEPSIRKAYCGDCGSELVGTDPEERA